MSHAAIILPRPFLAITKAITDWDKGIVELNLGSERIELPISCSMKYPKDPSEDVCLLSLVEEDDFGFDLYQHDLFSLDVKEAQEDPFKDIPNFLPPYTIELKPLPSHLKYAF